MPIVGDYHTHTVFSHGHGGIEDNVKAAAIKGLKEIAVTDHGFFHSFYGVRRMDTASMIEEVQRVRQLYPQISVYLGLESNLIDAQGRVDIEESDYEWLDVLVCGYHKCTKTTSLKELFGFKIPNFMSSVTKFSAKQVVKNTDAYLKALEKYRIDIISHPNYGIEADVVEIAKAAASYGTFIELNGKKVSMTDEEINGILSKTDAMFIIDSDAHDPSRVGKFDVPASYVERLGIPAERIANCDKIPVFRSKKCN